MQLSTGVARYPIIMPHLCCVMWWLLVFDPVPSLGSDLAQTDGDAGTAATTSDAVSWASAHRGDVRAVIRLSAELSSAPVQAEIVWRRRDKDPEGKIHRVDPKFAS
jgi:hypothetical protein